VILGCVYRVMIIAVAGAASGAVAEAPVHAPSVQVLDHFDGSVVPPYEIRAGEILFDLSHNDILNVGLAGAPSGFVVRVRIGSGNVRKMALNQGLIISDDGLNWRAVSFADDGAFLRATLDHSGKIVWLSTRYPYGRDNLDQLLADIQGTPGLHVYLLRRQNRIVPVFEFGKDDGRKPIHFIIGGEDVWETAGQWTVDAMVRTLASEPNLAAGLLAKAVVRIVPLTSPYSATQRWSSHVTVTGKPAYGAAAWTETEPPPEIALVREQVIEATKAGRLGLLLTVHSWQGQAPDSRMETIRTAGNRVIEGERLEWAKATLERLVSGVPRGSWKISEKIWHPGLARDYMLREHGAITFRIEVSTYGQGIEAFRETGRRLLANIAAIPDWGPVLPIKQEPIREDTQR